MKCLLMDCNLKENIMAKSVKDLQDSEFAATVASGTVLVDFWAPWCGPCRMQGPILEEVAAAIGDKAVIAKVNVDSSQETASKYGVQSIPTLIIFTNGKPVKQFVGVQQKDTLIAALEQFSGATA